MGTRPLLPMLGFSFSTDNVIKTDGLYLWVSLNARRCSSKWLKNCAGGSTRPDAYAYGWQEEYNGKKTEEPYN